MHLRSFRPGLALCALLGLITIVPDALAQPAFFFKENDRVVFLGATMLEREQTEGYLETLLTAQFARENLTFRNLAWSGDTVYGDSRAGFDTAKEGFERMVNQVHDAQPTVLMLSYGSNEAYEGKAGLESFIAGYNKLLDAVADTEARLIFWGLPHLENLGYPLPDSTRQNENVVLYNEAVRALATERGGWFIDLQPMLETTRHVAPLTENNLHFTDYGYWMFAQATLLGLGYEAPRFMAHGLRHFRIGLDTYFFAALPAESPEVAREEEVVHRIRYVSAIDGTYQLRLGDTILAEATSEEWSAGVPVPELEEVASWEALRAAVVEKNRLFFNKWRPQNHTYILGFRKHEQGQYAAEIPMYDPLVEAEEQKIAELRSPELARYTMHRVGADQ